MGFGWGDILKTAGKYALNPLLAVPDSVKYGKAGIKYLGEATGLKSTPSDAEKANLEQQRAFRDQMLAALNSRMANPLQAPQLGQASWMGATTPAGPGTVVGAGPSVGPPGAAAAPPYVGPPAGRARVPAGFDVPVAQSGANPAMAAELERIKRQKMLDAYGNAVGMQFPLG